MNVTTRFASHRRINRLLELGRKLSGRGHPVIALAVDALVRVLFSADIPSRAAIPNTVTFMHNGLGTIVDERVRFDGPALVFQHVTLGFGFGSRGGVPQLGSHVVVGAGAVVVGDLRLGDGAFVAANTVVTQDVPPGHMISGSPPVVRPRSAQNSEQFWQES